MIDSDKQRISRIDLPQGIPPLIRWILARQAGLAGVVAVVAWGLAGGNAAASALAGGACGVLPNLAYAWRAIRNVGLAGEGAPANALRAQMAGEAYKFMATFALFALIFVFYKKVAALPLFLGYTSTFAIYWVALVKQR
ncbi:MAG: ATP synthase subunit I [Candidatus Nitricoxidivorans perseverans]|uniref:ATP synthase subunit I n=1 Tax=Candidatus Nitricoxidivorans perseverans TaxID=2975601 RepID=A0AA49IXQ5_9PROT|nr:MAG: ATP synthase subunit I [Candidatus Nitricoxidivorans perseverans]